MICSESSAWNESIRPRVRRNTEDSDLIIIDLTGEQCGKQTLRLITSDTIEARILAAKLRQTAADLDAMADVIDGGKEPEADPRERLAQRMAKGLERALAQEAAAAEFPPAPPGVA